VKVKDTHAGYQTEAVESKVKRRGRRA